MRNLSTLAIALVGAGACGDPGDGRPGEQASAEAGVAAAPATGNVVEITARGYSLEAPARIPSGWTTLRLRNESGMEHFVIVERLPAGKTLADSRAEVVPVFQDALDLINAGRPDEGFAEFGRLPAWYSEVAFLGGPGLLAGGATGQTSLYLEPGTYVIECYVKTDGRFHSSDGMIAQIVVTDEPGGGSEPAATMELTLSNAGIAVDGELRPGLQTIKVAFAEQMTHEHGLGTDVHLVRLTSDAASDTVAQWMNWADPHGLSTPGPGEFLGGTHEMPAGSTAYFTALITPGRYAFVAEVPNPGEKGLLRAFTVSETP